MTADWLERACAFPDCGRRIFATGLCRTHYKQRRSGKGLAPIRVPNDLIGWLSGCVADRDRSECWEWPFFINANGYGRCHWRGPEINASAVALIMDGVERPAPPNHFVLHSCDNRPCVNPDHLRFGSHLDNMADARARNRLRSASGLSSPVAVLTAEDVRLIRASPLSQRKLAAQLNVSHHTVGSARRGTTYMDVL